MGSQFSCNWNNIHTYNMDKNYSSIWISLLNSVFVSIAFMVWYLIKVEDDQEDKIKEAKVVVEEEEVEVDSNEERHLYVKPFLRTNSNSLQYEEYCGYDAVTTINNNNNNSITDVNNNEVNMREIKPATPVDVEPKQKPVVKLGPTFQWPAHDNVLESLRSLQHTGNTISDDLRSKLQDNGIMRNSHEEQDKSVKLRNIARITGKKLSKKQVCVIFDNFQSHARPGLEHIVSNNVSRSPSPRNRKPNQTKKNIPATVKSQRKTLIPDIKSNQTHIRANSYSHYYLLFF